MKKIISIVSMALVALSIVSCDKAKPVKGQGTLSFDSFTVECDDYVETKAVSPASGNYTIFVLDENGDVVKQTTYAAVKGADNTLTLPAGKYTLEARSAEENVPVAEFEQPIYGASTSFTIQAGETTNLGSLTCSLLQCKVTVSYSDDFLAMVTGDGVATVEVSSGYPLSYAMTYSGGSVSYEQGAGYFAVNNGANTTMEVTFKGNIEGRSQKMTKTFTGIAAKQWRQVKFIKKVDEEGNATFDVVINDMVDDEELNNSLAGLQDIIGGDPNAPKGDGDIRLLFDYENGCDAEFTDLNNLVMPQMSERKIKLVLKAVVPNGVKKFSVDITSTNEAFVSAVQAAAAEHLDLINPSEDNAIIFQVVPFPHGAELLNQTELSFELSAAQEAITIYPGVHNFCMNITDQQGCRNSIPVVMVVE
ncbi:MAG: DUF4493 domain-containing protein [Bacteroidales bacterium]|nr:DUF4493 domain-containing protein [Candidatus Cryptobacteroides caccocaballi]